MVQIFVTLKLTSQILLALHKEIIVNAVVTNLRKHCKIPLVMNPCGAYNVLILMHAQLAMKSFRITNYKCGLVSVLSANLN